MGRERWEARIRGSMPVMSEPGLRLELDEAGLLHLAQFTSFGGLCNLNASSRGSFQINWNSGS